MRNRPIANLLALAGMMSGLTPIQAQQQTMALRASEQQASQQSSRLAIRKAVGVNQVRYVNFRGSANEYRGLSNTPPKNQRQRRLARRRRWAAGDKKAFV